MSEKEKDPKVSKKIKKSKPTKADIIVSSTKDYHKKKCKKKYDFGKKVINYTFIMMFLHFAWMCFLSYKQIENSIFTEFTHDFKWIYLTIFGLTIWKEKFLMTIQKAKEFGLKPKNFDELSMIIPKDTQTVSDNMAGGIYGDSSGYGYNGYDTDSSTAVNSNTNTVNEGEDLGNQQPTDLGNG